MAIVFTYFVDVKLEHSSFFGSKKMSWYINIYFITDLFGYLRTWPNKCYRSMCCLEMTKFMDQRNDSNPCSANPSIQRHCIDKSRSLENMHFWKVTRQMTDDNCSHDTIHLFHSLTTYACESSNCSKITWEGNHAYPGWYLHLFYLVWYKVFD